MNTPDELAATCAARIVGRTVQRLAECGVQLDAESESIMHQTVEAELLTMLGPPGEAAHVYVEAFRAGLKPDPE